jgi:hypothetical protein
MRKPITYAVISYIALFISIIALCVAMSGCSNKQHKYSGRYQGCKNMRN